MIPSPLDSAAQDDWIWPPIYLVWTNGYQLTLGSSCPSPGGSIRLPPYSTVESHFDSKTENAFKKSKYFLLRFWILGTETSQSVVGSHYPTYTREPQRSAKVCLTYPLTPKYAFKLFVSVRAITRCADLDEGTRTRVTVSASLRNVWSRNYSN